MRQNINITEGIFPMPVLMVATYNDDGSVNVMNAAWGTMQARDVIALNLTETHKTVANIRARGAFTVSIADAAHLVQADYFGVESGNRVPDKFARSGLTARKSTFVDAPVVEEFPVVMECELIDVIEKGSFFCAVGRIVNTAADERVLNEKGTIDAAKLDALMFDTFGHGYYSVGEKAGQAWNAGAGLMKKV